MTTQTVTAQELMEERPEMVESIIDLIIADSIATLVETDDTYSHLLPLFIRSGEDIVENYKSAKQEIDLSTEYQALYPLVEEVIDNIGSDLFTDMLDIDENASYSEVLRCFGHGVSFWDSWDCKLFGLKKNPKLKTTIDAPYIRACLILNKIAASYPQKLVEDEEEDSEFDIWLSTNYSPAGEDASNGEKYYLSTNPNEYLPKSESELRHQWESEKYITELPEDEKQYWLVVVDNRTSETIYCRELTNDGDLLMVPRSYIPEIQEATGILIDKKSGNYPGCGQIGVTIGFSAIPENDVSVWDTEDYNLVRQLNNPPINRVDPKLAHIEF